MAAANEVEWRGAAVHGFESPLALNYAVANAGSRFLVAQEVCGKLMNGPRYANPNPPRDSDDHKDFYQVLVADQVYQDLSDTAMATPKGWLYYQDNLKARTPERRVTNLKISDELFLPTFEISAGQSRLRRRVILPPALTIPGEPEYHFLQYKLLPNLSGSARANLLGGLAHGDCLEEEAAAAKAAWFKNIAGGEELTPEEWEERLAQVMAEEAEVAAAVARAEAGAAFDAFLEQYHSSEDGDYLPNPEDEADAAEAEAEDADDHEAQAEEDLAGC